MSKKQDFLPLAEKLLHIESTEDKPNNLIAVMDHAASYLSNPKISIKRFIISGKPSLVATMEKTKTPTVMLNGHLDVVPAKHEQFIPRIKGDKLYARGAQDMKAACAVMMHVFRSLAQDSSFPTNKLGLMLVTDEETGGFNGSKALLEKGFRPHFLITGESTNLNLEVASKGVLWLKIISVGKASHAAHLWNGINAITPFSQVIERISALYPIPHKPSWKTTCNISSIVGGSVTNRVPDRCELTLDLRYVPKDKPEMIIKNISKILPEGMTMQTLIQEPYSNTQPRHPYLKKLKTIVHASTGKEVKFIKQHGASDARFFSEAGIPTTSFGPTGDGLHSDQEWVSITSLQNYKSILERWLQKI